MLPVWYQPALSRKVTIVCELYRPLEKPWWCQGAAETLVTLPLQGFRAVYFLVQDLLNCILFFTLQEETCNNVRSYWHLLVVSDAQGSFIAVSCTDGTSPRAVCPLDDCTGGHLIRVGLHSGVSSFLLLEGFCSP